MLLGLANCVLTMVLNGQPQGRRGEERRGEEPVPIEEEGKRHRRTCDHRRRRQGTSRELTAVGRPPAWSEGATQQARLVSPFYAMPSSPLIRESLDTLFPTKARVESELQCWAANSGLNSGMSGG